MNNATLKQISYLLYLLEDQGMIRNGADIAKFEELVKAKVFTMDKRQISDLIEKLKSDRKWMEMITNQILGVD